MRQAYNPKNDPTWQEPYVDIDEERVHNGIPHRYIHGGFKGTDLKFSLYFPEPDKYEGRFFQYLPPAANHEDASQKLSGGDDKITFALTHGAYFVESNLAVLNPFAPGANSDKTLTYRASAAVAEYSRQIAQKVYGKIKRPYGYVYGGSGGAYKTFSCAENTDIWDGAVPYVNGAPVSVPHNLTIRAHAMRVLRNKMADIYKALKPEGSGDMYAGLNDSEREALDELLEFGFPVGAVSGLEFMKDGSLPLLIGGIKRGDTAYFKDYWDVEGYAGADKTSDAYASRLHHKTKITGKYVPERGESKSQDNTTGVDTNWQRYKGMSGALGVPLIQVESMPTNNFYLMGCFVNVLTGKAAGRRVYFDEYNGNTVKIAEYFGCDDMMEIMDLIEEGDEVLLDNSDYIAATDYHLHALPYEVYSGYSRCYENGKPKYPQRDHVVNFTGAGKQTGDFTCKMILEHTYCDESAFPYQGDWYKKLVYKVQGEKNAKNRFRLQYMDNALHDDRAEPVSVELQYVTNLATIYQCLLDLVDWVEKGIEPPAESVYSVSEGIITPADGAARRGIQNICKLYVNGKRSATVKVGEKVSFSVDVELPKGAGKLTKVEWSFEGEKDYPVKSGTKTDIKHTFEKPGKYSVVVRTYNERNGDDKTPFTQIRNISYVTVTVE